LLCYGSLAGGFMSERWLGVEEPRETLENRSLTKYKLIIDEFGGWGLFQKLLHTLSQIAEHHSVGVAAVAIRWVLDQPGVNSVIVGARNQNHLAGTLAALRLRLTSADQEKILDVLSESTCPGGDVYALERDRQGVHGRIMRYNLNTK
jgi:aryl-alcohol dehydrogenase-like predicted oxidoreductase